MKNKALQHIFEDKHVPVRLRLKLFDAAITSTVLYSLENCPMTEKIQSRLNVVQRTMIRRLIGWVSHTDESWEVIGHRMKMRLQFSLQQYPIGDWSESILKRKEKTLSKMNELPFWTRSSLNWDVVECSGTNFHFAFRSRGRPLTRWHDKINPCDRS